MTGIAVASACRDCAQRELPGGEEYAPGRYMGIIDGRHVPELVAGGWILTEYPHQEPDIVCRHYAALCAADTHG